MKHDCAAVCCPMVVSRREGQTKCTALAGGMFGWDSLQEQSPAAGRWLEQDQTWLPLISGMATSLTLGLLGGECIWGNGG